MTANTNRAISLTGANKIFSVAQIEIKHSPLGFYESSGRIALQASTLTGRCQQLIQALMECKENAGANTSTRFEIEKDLPVPANHGPGQTP